MVYCLVFQIPSIYHNCGSSNTHCYTHTHTHADYPHPLDDGYLAASIQPSSSPIRLYFYYPFFPHFLLFSKLRKQFQPMLTTFTRRTRYWRGTNLKLASCTNGQSM